MNLAATICVASAGAALLWGFYRGLEMRWPDYYITLNDTFALRVSERSARVLGFRALPVFVAAVGTGTTTDRLGGWGWCAIAGMLLLHLAQTNARGFVESIRGRRGRHEFAVNHAMYHLSTAVIASASGVLGSISYRRLEFLVPKPEDLVQNLWIAGFVTVAGGLALALVGNTSNGREVQGDRYLIWRASRDIGVDLLDFAFAISVRNHADPVLLRAIMIVEVLQRPRWVRRLERIKGFFFGKGSYGVTQEQSDQPIGDEESIERTSMKLDRWGTREVEGQIYVDNAAIWAAVARHNPEHVFISAVQHVYNILLYAPQPNLQADEFSDLRILELRRYPSEMGIRVITEADKVVLSHDGVELASALRPALSTAWATELRAPISSAQMSLSVYAGDEVREGRVIAAFDPGP